MGGYSEKLRVFFSNRRNVYLTIVSAVLVVAALILVVILINLNSNPSGPDKKIDISEEEKGEILSEIVKNNSKEIIKKPTSNETFRPPISPQNPSTPTPNNPNTNSPSSPNLPDPEAVPDINEYNYRVTEIKYNDGPAAELCKLDYHYGGYLGAGQDNRTVRSYEFFDLRNSYYKTERFDQDNELSDYDLTHYSNTVNNFTMYRLGDFAVKYNYAPYADFSNQKEVATISYPGDNLPVEESLGRYFGPDVEIYDIKVINGVTYYIIQYSYEVYCNNSNPYLYIPGVEPAKAEKLITQLLVDGRSFDVLRSELYFKSVSPSSLISSVTTSTTRDKVTFASINDEFVFEFDVPVRTIDFTNFTVGYTVEDIANRMAQHLPILDLDIPFVKLDSGYSLIRAFASGSNPTIPGTDFYKERSFYRPGAKGDEIFEQITEANSSPQTIMNLTYSTGEYNYLDAFYIDIYNNDVSFSEIIDSITEYPSTSTDTSEVVVKFNDEEITATKILRSFEYRYPESFPISGPISTYTSQNIVFVFNGKVYNISGTEMNLTVTEYEVLNTQNPDDLPKIISRVYNSFNWGRSPESYPTYYPF